jgi:hypothetical protein
MSLPVVTSAPWVILRADDAAQQRQMGGQLVGLSQRVRTGVQEVPEGGWKTFVSATLPVTVDYPPDWSVREEATGVTFNSTRGATIHVDHLLGISVAQRIENAGFDQCPY